MTTLLLEVVAAADIDLALASVPELRLWRAGDAVHLSIDASQATRVTRLLAFAGVRATASDDQLPRPAAGLIRAIGFSAAPVELAGPEFEVLDLRRVEVGPATARLTGRLSRRWPLAARRRSRVRALLRETDVEFAVRREAWCTRPTVRGARHALRPVLFDRGAAAGPFRVFATDGSLARWMRG